MNDDSVRQVEQNNPPASSSRAPTPKPNHHSLEITDEITIGATNAILNGQIVDTFNYKSSDVMARTTILKISKFGMDSMGGGVRRGW